MANFNNANGSVNKFNEAGGNANFMQRAFGTPARGKLASFVDSNQVKSCGYSMPAVDGVATDVLTLLDVDDGTTEWTAGGGGSGDVVGTAPSVTDNLVSYSDATGLLIKDSGLSSSSIGDVFYSGIPAMPTIEEFTIFDQTDGKKIKNSGVRFPTSAGVAGEVLALTGPNTSDWTAAASGTVTNPLAVGSTGNLVKFGAAPNSEIKIADSGIKYFDVVEGPPAAVDGGNVVFDGATGKLIKNSTTLANLTVNDLKTGTNANTISTTAATTFLAFRNSFNSDRSMICFGSGAGASWTIDQASDGHNVAIGFDAMNLANQPNSSNNIAIGTEALADASGAGCQSNIAIGRRSLKALVDGSSRVSIGNSSQENNTNSTSSKQNVSLGSFTLNKGTNLEINTALGTNALRYLNTTGALAENNIAIGNESGLNYTSTESDNITIGSRGVVLDQGAIHIGRSAVNTSCFIQGIAGVSLPTAKTVTVGAGGQLGYREFGQLISIPYGADMDSINKYAIGNGKAEEKDENSKEETRMPLMGGKLLKLLYKTQQADATTELEVVINGIGTTTVALTGDSGVADLDITVSDGNWAEIRYSAGTSPERSTFLLILGVTGFS